MAAAVFEFGRLEQSPRDQMFENLLCLKVCLSTSTKPASFVIPASFRKLWGLIGGTMWRKSYGFTIFSFVSMFSNTAEEPVNSVKLCLNVRLIWYLLATFVRPSLYLGTPKSTGAFFMNYMSALIPFFFHSSAQRYMIFWGAPAHLIGRGGSVKIAFPPLNFFPTFPVFWE